MVFTIAAIDVNTPESLFSAISLNESAAALLALTEIATLFSVLSIIASAVSNPDY